LNITFLDEDEAVEQAPLRRYRSEPDFRKVWRSLGVATENTRVMANHIHSKKDMEEDAFSEIHLSPKMPPGNFRRKADPLEEDAFSGSESMSPKSCQSSGATSITREPNSPTESLDSIEISLNLFTPTRPRVRSPTRRGSSKETPTGCQMPWSSGEPTQQCKPEIEPLSAIETVSPVKRTSWADISEKISEKTKFEQEASGSCRVLGSNGKKIRPCKSKRQRYRKFVNKLKDQVELCPETFSMDDVRLPESLFFCEQLKNKFGETLQMHHSQVLQGREQDIVHEQHIDIKLEE
jgi:hypothetical protein